MITLYDMCLIYNVRLSMLLAILYKNNIPMIQEDLESSTRCINLNNIPDNFRELIDEAKEKGRSRGEDQMFRYIESLGIRVIPNDRTVIRPKELDMYMPDFNIGIEYDGLYWHKESSLA